MFELNGSDEQVTVGVPIPWERLGVLCAGTIAVSVGIAVLSLLFLGRSIRPARSELPLEEIGDTNRSTRHGE